ncbi:hypothetical protein [Terrabacter sp. BE26]|uniref:hypothetical protein n=1 Tax=Terrabacter sp. BE26 TaxID=2898152 RepID=UPI0035BE533A
MGIPDRLLSRPLRPIGFPYVVIVAALATVGFTMESTPLILLAALLTLPSSVIAVPSYYVLYGLLAQIPGANPSDSTGSGSCTLGGGCYESTAGGAATWFTDTTELLGMLMLLAAAVFNVVMLQRLIAARQPEAGAAEQAQARVASRWRRASSR